MSLKLKERNDLNNYFYKLKQKYKTQYVFIEKCKTFRIPYVAHVPFIDS